MKYDNENKHKNREPLSSTLLMDQRHPVGQSLTCEHVRAVVEYVLSTKEKKFY